MGSGGGGWEGGSAGVKVINQGEVSSKLPTKPPPTKTNFNNKKTKKRTRKKQQQDKNSKSRKNLNYKEKSFNQTKPNKYQWINSESVYKFLLILT